MNERWRVALAGLVAVLAIPFFIVDSPAPAEGVVTEDKPAVDEQLAAPVDDDVSSEDFDEADATPNAVEIVQVDTEVSPDVTRLAAQAGAWGAARAEAVADGRLGKILTGPQLNTDYSLLPIVNTPDPEPPVDLDPVDPDPVDPDSEEPVDPDPVDPDSEEPVDPNPDPVDPPVIEPDPEEPKGPAAPPQVNGRVPPPADGPTAAQWDAVRKCESTHNYRAISPTGLYRGAYQFSQQTWDWVAGIHWVHLVAVDPVDAEPAWQDVMAYTLYAMRGWDQWPICGKNLL
ncbi:MAG: hypothetical protein ACI81L_000125 [Verrucomicrobiales bacterium]